MLRSTAAGSPDRQAGGSRLLLFWIAGAALRRQPWRWLIAIVSIALGVALAVAIDAVNRSAIGEFEQALSSINGEAQLQINARGEFFDERLFARVSALPDIEVASPLIELNVEHDAPATPGAAAPRRLRVRLLGIDPLQAGRITPDLVPLVERAANPSRDDASPAAAALFDPDAVFINAALRAQLPANAERIELRHGDHRQRLVVRGSAAQAAGNQALAVMDLAAMQWRFGLLGKLSRIDLRAVPGVSVDTLRERLQPLLPADVSLTRPSDGVQRMSNLSRAYRVNLNVLALVALFTGMFLLYTSVTLASVRQRPQLALLGVLGASRRFIAACVLSQGMVCTVSGTLLGVLGGLGLGAVLLELVGGDLGGGYFYGQRPELRISPSALSGFAAISLAAGALASWLPARAAAAGSPIGALRGAAAEAGALHVKGERIRLIIALLLALVAAALLRLPPILNLPLAAYAAIALLLVAGIAAMPVLVRATLRALDVKRWLWTRPPLWLAALRSERLPAYGAGAVAGIVASFALTSAMAVMVTSFRDSVTHWLDQVLPADFYARAPAGAAWPEQKILQRLAPLGLRIETAYSFELTLDPREPPVAILIRQLDRRHPAARLPITGSIVAVPDDQLPVYISEPLANRLRLQPGDRLELPIAATRQSFVVAAVWRDYARQTGALIIDAASWRRLSDERSVNDLAIWLPAQAPNGLAEQLNAALPPGWDLRSAGQLRELSLRIFDRSFALTYALEAAALLVGLFGVASGYAGQALVRSREFGMLRHIGYRRGEVLLQIGAESAVLATIATLWGAVLGVLIGLILIKRVNPQSFHWTMELQMPWLTLSAAGALLIGAATLSAVLAARGATSGSAVRAVHDDA